MASKKDNRDMFMDKVNTEDAPAEMPVDAPEAMDVPAEDETPELPAEGAEGGALEMESVNSAIDAFKSDVDSGGDMKAALGRLISSLVAAAGSGMGGDEVLPGDEAPLNPPMNY
jgi:hypothetical protein